jgi:hypothetical protein
MFSLLALLPLVLMFVFYALLVKLAAKLYRRSLLQWRHAFAFGAIAMLVGVLGALLNRASGLILGPLLGFVLGLTIQLVLGGWYLGPRTFAPTGETIAFKGGVLVAAIAYGLAVTLAVVAAVLVPLPGRGGQA